MADRALAHGWQVLPFREIAENITERVDDPSASGLDHYVGLEHLDSDTLKISRWGAPSDVGATKLRFYPGDVIYARRRAYQRKLGVAEWDGICSAHALVLRARPNNCLPEFLPFFLQSDAFHQRALDISVGSLSPTINWRTLAVQEFAVPPLSHQALVGTTLGSTQGLSESIEVAFHRLDELVNAVISGHYRVLSDAAPRVLITEMAELTMGRQKAPKYELGSSPTPYVRVANVGHLELALDELEVMDFDATDVARYRLMPGDVLVTEGDIVSPLNVGRSAVFPEDGPTCCFQNTLIRLRPAEGIEPPYLMAMVEGARLSGLLASTAKTTTVSHLGLRRLSEVRLPLANRELQREIGAQVTSLLAFRTRLREFRARTSNVDRALRDRLMAARV
jgi:type I restriction enzyme S subunit